MSAVPTLRALCDLRDGNSQYARESVIALYRLAPDGGEIAKKWLEKSPRPRNNFSAHDFRLESRAMVLAAMRRTSLEGDAVTRDLLDWMNFTLAFPDPRDDGLDYLEERIEAFGRLGVGARLAIPRLKKLASIATPGFACGLGRRLKRSRGRHVSSRDEAPDGRSRPLDQPSSLFAAAQRLWGYSVLRRWAKSSARPSSLSWRKSTEM